MKIPHNPIFKVLSLCLIASLSTCNWLDDLEQISFIEVIDFSIDQTTLSQNFISTTASATLNGLRENLDNVDDHGFIWIKGNGLPDLTTNDGQAALGAKGNNGSYEAQIDDLSPSQNFTFRAYAILKGQEVYSEPITLSTPAPGFNLATQLIAPFVMTSGGPKIDIQTNIFGLTPGTTIKDVGILWSIGKAPTETEGNKISVGSILIASGNNSFSNSINNLIPGESYYIKPFLAIGDGLVLGDVVRYYVGDIWVKKQNFPTGNVWGAAALSLEGLGHVYGGTPNFPETHSVYNPVLDTWMVYDGFEHLLRSYDATAFVLDNEGYVVNGFFRPTETWKFTYDGNRPNWSFTQNMPDENQAVISTWSFVLDGKVYIGGGRQKLGEFEFGLWFYPNENGQWEEWLQPQNWDNQSGTYPLPPVLGRTGASAFVIDNVAYIGPGYNAFNASSGSYEFDMWAFYPSGEWKKIENLPEALNGRVDYSAFSINGKGYIALGQNSFDLFQTYNDIWEYDPNTNQWTERRSFPGAPRKDALNFTINGRAYLGTGQGFFREGGGGARNFNDMYEYIPIDPPQ